MVLSGTTSRALQPASMEELPEYFWLHMTSAVVLVLLALMATAALLRWTVDEVENLWRRRRSRGH